MNIKILKINAVGQPELILLDGEIKEIKRMAYEGNVRVRKSFHGAGKYTGASGNDGVLDDGTTFNTRDDFYKSLMGAMHEANDIVKDGWKIIRHCNEDYVKEIKTFQDIINKQYNTNNNYLSVRNGRENYYNFIIEFFQMVIDNVPEMPENIYKLMSKEPEFKSLMFYLRDNKGLSIHDVDMLPSDFENYKNDVLKSLSKETLKEYKEYQINLLIDIGASNDISTDKDINYINRLLQ